MRYGLSERTLSTINAIFQKYPDVKQVILYGSRAKGNFRNGSDIDLSLKTEDSFTRTSLLGIANDFDDSDLPYFVDVSVYDKLSSQSLKAHIDRVGKVIYSSQGDGDSCAHNDQEELAFPLCKRQQ